MKGRMSSNERRRLNNTFTRLELTPKGTAKLNYPMYQVVVRNRQGIVLVSKQYSKRQRQHAFNLRDKLKAAGFYRVTVKVIG